VGDLPSDIADLTISRGAFAWRSYDEGDVMA
jgi:hypothetical protein